MTSEDNSLKDTITRDEWKSLNYEATLPYIENRWKSGNPLALYDGLDACEKTLLPLPAWLSTALKEILVSALTGQVSEKQAFRTVREQFEKLKRVFTVTEIREWQKDRRNYEAFPFDGLERLFDGEFDHYGPSVTDACAIAEIILSGSYAEASAETIQDNWRRNKRERSKHPFELKGALPATREAFGFIHGPNRVKVPQKFSDALAEFQAEREDIEKG